MTPGIYWSEVTENYVIYGWEFYGGGTVLQDLRTFIIEYEDEHAHMDFCEPWRLLVFKLLKLEWVCEF